MQGKDIKKSTSMQLIEEISDKELLKQLCERLGLDSIHGSTISRRLASLSTEALEILFINLKNRCIAKIGLNAATDSLIGYT